MKSTFIIASLALLTVHGAQASLIAYWSFTSGQPSRDISTGISLADVGNATLSLQDWGGSSSIGSNGGRYTHLNELSSEYGGNGHLILTTIEGNGTYVDLQLSTEDYSDITLSWLFRRNGRGFIYTSSSWSWSINGTDFYDIGSGESIDNHNSYDLLTLTLPEAASEQSSIILRYTLNGATAPSNNNDGFVIFDNIQINGTAVQAPEPSVVLLSSSLAVLFLFRRRS